MKAAPSSGSLYLFQSLSASDPGPTLQGARECSKMCVASGEKAALSLGPNWDEGGQNPQKIEGNYLEGLGAKNKTKQRQQQQNKTTTSTTKTPQTPAFS